MQFAPSIGLIKLLLILPGVGYLALMMFAVLFANKLVFPIPPAGYSDSEDIIRFPYDSSGNEVSLVYLRNPASQHLIYYHHGNGEDLKSILPRLQALREAGFSVLAWDYPGYGTSDGKPSEKLVLEIAEKIFQAIPSSFGYEHESVILYGRSLGGAPAIYLAQSYKAAGLIAEGVFTSIFRVGIGVNILPWDMFNNMVRIRSLRCPSLFIHGTSDRTVPFSHGVKLHREAPAPKFFTWIQGGKHNDIIDTYSDTYYSSINRFREFISSNRSN